MSSAQLEKFASVKPANIEWRNNLPFSLEFNDVYYSDSGALEESEHVFLKGCRLEDDWLSTTQNRFYLAELGFGSGLNFFNAVDLWHQKIKLNPQHSHKQMHYISIEKRPFSLADFKRSCLAWPQFQIISSQLIRTYPSTTYGRHQIYFESLNITLTLLYMPAEDALSELITESELQQNKIKIDHWFLDGFAPSKNESMWGQKLMQKIAILSKVGTRLATYSVAASVKNPIKEAGFSITKTIGFGRKREMLTATLENLTLSNHPKFINLKHERPWFQQSFSAATESIAIIGGGIAGCTTAYALAQKGIKVELFESHSQLATQASGAAAGIFHPQLTSDININSQFSWLSYLTLLNFLSSLTEHEKQSVILSQGLYRFLESPKIKQQLLSLTSLFNLQQWIKDPAAFSDTARAIFFPDAAALNMAAFCELLFNKIPQHKKQLHLASEVSEIKYVNDFWIFNANNKSHQFKHLVFCGGATSPLLKQLINWPSRISRGQTCFINSPELANTTKQTLCEKIYIVPRPNNNFHLGTTFEEVNDFNFDSTLSPQSQKEILNQTGHFFNELEAPFIPKSSLEELPLKGTIGYRLHSLDRLPMVGAMPDQHKVKEDFNNLGQRRLIRNINHYYNQKGLWLNTAYGSHGLLYSLLASQHLTSLITYDISPINNQISQAIDPMRFVINQFK